MTPEELARMNKLEKLVESLVSVKNIEFIESLKRRVTVAGITSGSLLANTTIVETVRDAAGTGTSVVAKDPDSKLQVTLSDGTTKYIGVYNS